MKTTLGWSAISAEPENAKAVAAISSVSRFMIIESKSSVRAQCAASARDCRFAIKLKSQSQERPERREEFVLNSTELSDAIEKE